MNVLDIQKDTTVKSGLSNDRFNFEFIVINTATEVIIGYFKSQKDAIRHINKEYKKTHLKFIEVLSNPYYLNNKNK
jgi:DNA-dependent RNA polymerase auxiliary subunit epsilon